MPPVPLPLRRQSVFGAAVTAAMAALFVGSIVLSIGLALDWAISGYLHLGRAGMVTGGIVAAAAALAGTVAVGRRAFAAERAMTAAGASVDEDAAPGA